MTRVRLSDTEPARTREGNPLLGINPQTESSVDLFEEYARTRDIQLRNRLVLMHDRLARGLASRFGSSGGSTEEDLRQVAYLGLITSIERFDPTTGNRFVTFATATILGIIKHYLRDHGWLLKAPRRLRELGMSLRKTRTRLEMELGRVPTVPEVARAANLDEELVLQAMDIERLYHPSSLDHPARDSSGDLSAEFLAAIGANEPRYALIDDQEAADRLLSFLDAREQEILRQRYYDEATQAEVAHRLGISQMHVSRLERRALQRLREMIA